SKKKAQKADRSVAFNPLPLLIVDEIIKKRTRFSPPLSDNKATKSGCISGFFLFGDERKK
ncbi:hypothetical protein, partial [Barnesiella intestinihominis]|uniref:hypothetical protein n=1 Tax=Barnesiella intestinihominis TaxID=487174 RepID=UPI004024B9A3